jgi:ubiquinone biosynthesis protein COQ9
MKGAEMPTPDTLPDTMEATRTRLLQAALPHVPFDGWSEAALTAAATESATPPALARALFPRAGIDLALAYHRLGDDQMREAIAATDLGALRFRDRIATAVKLRLLHADRELARRGTALFALPRHAAEGARAVWGTADAIWTALGDNSTDLNWYTKRATLSAVYGATVLYWMGDDTADHAATWEFLDRRIENVMRFEASKAKFRENSFGKAFLNGPLKVLERVRAPQAKPDLPGKI